jgi:hypothetical protein
VWQSGEYQVHQRITSVSPLLVVIGLSYALITPTFAAQEPPVWFWFATCGGPSLTLEMRFDKVTVEKVTLPLCRSLRSSAGSQGQTASIAFSLTPGRAIVWSGYRDASDRTRAGQVLDVDIWQAGADPDALMLGVSVVTARRSLMNTVHIAHPDRRDESTIAPGLTLATYPASR